MKAVSRPNEVICMVQFDIPTKEGNYPIFVAFDQFTHLCLLAEVMEEMSANNMMKAVYMMMDNEHVSLSEESRFTLFINFGQEYIAELQSVASPYGDVVYDPEYAEASTIDDLTSLMGASADE